MIAPAQHPIPFVVIYYHMTLRGRQRLTDREGKRLVAYLDSRRIWTIGVGHAATAGTPPHPVHGMTITAEQCDEILTRDLASREKRLSEALKVPVADHEFDALLSVMFNVDAFIHSTAMKCLNAGDRAGCARHILDWNEPASIIGRRHTEQSQFLTPYTMGT